MAEYNEKGYTFPVDIFTPAAAAANREYFNWIFAEAATRGTLVVHLRSATNLRRADRGGSSDPYVKLKLGGSFVKFYFIHKLS